MIAGKAVDLGRLRDELVTAGLITGDLRSLQGDIRELKADGAVADLPAGARAVIDAHVGPDQQATESTAAKVDIKAKVQAATAILDQTTTDMNIILAFGGTATAAQLTSAVKLLAGDIKALVPLIRALGRSAVDEAGS